MALPMALFINGDKVNRDKEKIPGSQFSNREEYNLAIPEVTHTF